MHASTHGLGLHAPAGLGSLRLRKPKGAPVATAAAEFVPGALSLRVADGLPSPHSRSDWDQATAAGDVEDVLFAITFAALALLWPGAYLLHLF